MLTRTAPEHLLNRPKAAPTWGQSARIALEVSAWGHARVVYYPPGSRSRGVPVAEGSYASLTQGGQAQADALRDHLMGAWMMRALGCTTTREHLEGAAARVADALRGLVRHGSGWRVCRGVTMRTVARMVEQRGVGEG